MKIKNWPIIKDVMREHNYVQRRRKGKGPWNNLITLAEVACAQIQKITVKANFSLSKKCTYANINCNDYFQSFYMSTDTKTNSNN